MFVKASCFCCSNSSESVRVGCWLGLVVIIVTSTFLSYNYHAAAAISGPLRRDDSKVVALLDSVHHTQAFPLDAKAFQSALTSLDADHYFELNWFAP